MATATATKKGTSPFGDDSTVEVFPATADGLLRYWGSTEPKPPRAAIVAHARTLIDSGQINEGGRQRLVSAGFTELND